MADTRANYMANSRIVMFVLQFFSCMREVCMQYSKYPITSIKILTRKNYSREKRNRLKTRRRKNKLRVFENNCPCGKENLK